MLWKKNLEKPGTLLATSHLGRPNFMDLRLRRTRLIRLPLLDMMIAEAHKCYFGSLLLTGDTPLTSRAKSSCEFGRPEVRDLEFLDFRTDVNGNFVKVSGSTYFRCLNLLSQDTWIFDTYGLMRERYTVAALGDVSIRPWLHSSMINGYHQQATGFNFWIKGTMSKFGNETSMRRQWWWGRRRKAYPQDFNDTMNNTLAFGH